MNWSKIKSIFIVLFLISDLFLMGLLINSHMKKVVISPEVIASTVEILKSNSVNIDTGIIPKKIGTAHYTEAENVIDDYAVFAKKILGDTLSAVSDEKYESPSGIITFSGNSFIFESSSENRSAERRFSENDAISLASDFLKNADFDISHAEIKCEKGEYGYNVTFLGNINSLPFFDSSAEVTLSGNTVTSAHGVWFNPVDAAGSDSALKSITSVLIDILPEFDTSEGEITISEISLGYIVPESNMYHKSASLVPVWKIVDTAGKTYYSDARSAER